MMPSRIHYSGQNHRDLYTLLQGSYS
jgi:hypothetical protein